MRGLRGIAPPGTRYDYVSVHVPKTGGTTLLKALQRRFRNRLYLHYPDAEPRGPFHTLSPVRAVQGRLAAPGLCVHGHVPASTHWHPDCKLLVFLREPAAQAVSNWRYIHRFHEQTGKVANEGWRDILEMDLETFLDQPSMALRRFVDLPMERFDFVGLLEHYEEDMARLCGMLGLSYRPTHANAAPSDYEIPVELRDRFTRANPEEMALYRAGQTRRRELLSAAE